MYPSLKFGTAVLYTEQFTKPVARYQSIQCISPIMKVERWHHYYSGLQFRLNICVFRGFQKTVFCKCDTHSKCVCVASGLQCIPGREAPPTGSSCRVWSCLAPSMATEFEYSNRTAICCKGTEQLHAVHSLR